MSSELTSLARLLGRAGDSPPTGRELAEVLWLAGQSVRQTSSAADEDTVGDEDERVPTARPAEAGHPVADRPGPPRPRQPSPPSAPRPAPTGDRVPMRIPAGPHPRPDGRPPTAGHTSLLAPGPPMLAHPLALQRSLRPLRRSVPSPFRRQLDEAETAHRIAALGARPELWLPVLAPRKERWLHLRLVFDSGPTMAMWRPLLRDLHTAFAQTGAFRTLDVVRLSANGTVPRRHWERGRTAVLVISDCMGPQWREGPAARRWYATLRAWARDLPVAVVQPLPERLWRHTAFPAAAGVFTTPGPGAPNAALDFTTYETYETTEPHEEGFGSGIPVPVLEPSPEWLGHWAALVASPGVVRIPGAAALPRVRPAALAAAEQTGLEQLGPEELVLRFRSIASPQAFRLASHLAVGTAHLPVMRLVQAAIDEHPLPQHLAEVVLSGMLKSPPGAPAGAYDFRPGVRRVLLGTLPRTALVGTAALLGRVSAEIEARAGAVPGEFRALVTDGGPAGGGPAGGPFALLSAECVRLLRGPETAPEAPPPHQQVVVNRYALDKVVGRGTTGVVWRAYDLHSSQWAAVKIYPAVDAHGREAAEFLARTQAAVAANHAHLVDVHDVFLREDVCGLAMELVEGATLRQLITENLGGLPARLVIRTGHALLSGLLALHEAGITHGDVKPQSVLMRSEGSPVLAGFECRRPIEAGPEGDLYALGRILYEMATGTRPDPDHPVPPRRLVAGMPRMPRTLELAIMDLVSGHVPDRTRGAERLSALDADPGTWSETPRWHYRVLSFPLAEAASRDMTLSLPPEPATFLARLLLARGAFVPEPDLRAAMGRDSVLSPDEAARYLQSLGHDIQLSEEGDGYRLGLDRSELDLVIVDRHAQTGNYGAALALWYGRPLDGLEGEWAEEARGQLTEWQASLSRSRDEQVHGVIRLTTGWILLDFAELGAELAERFTATVRHLTEQEFGHLSKRSVRRQGTISMPIPPHTMARSLVDWAVEEVPQRLVRKLTGAAPALPRVRIVMFPGGTEDQATQIAAQLPVQTDVPGAELVVTVWMPDRLFSRLDRAYTTGFHPLAAAHGWYRVIVVRNDAGQEGQQKQELPDVSAPWVPSEGRPLPDPSVNRPSWLRWLFPRSQDSGDE
jgi:hypothetical protein